MSVQRSEERREDEVLQQHTSHAHPGNPPRSDVDLGDAEPTVPELPDPPMRHTQDTQPVNGDTATHLPPGEELVQRSDVQG